MSKEDSITEARKAYESKDFHKSAEIFASVLEVQQSAQVYYEYAICLLQLQQKKKALLQLDKALELDPRNPFRYSSRAYVRDANGDLKGAIEDYKACIKIDPEDAIAHNNLGLLFEKQGRKEAAKHHIKQADKLSEAYEYLENQKRIDHEEKSAIPKEDLKSKSFGAEILNVFRDKKSRSEFFTFVRKGWKL